MYNEESKEKENHLLQYKELKFLHLSLLEGILNKGMGLGGGDDGNNLPQPFVCELLFSYIVLQIA